MSILSNDPNHWEGEAALAAFLDAMPWRAAMEACEQDKVFHAEGDVMVHTRMVCSALLGDRRVASLSPSARRGLALSAGLHDCMKPKTATSEWDESMGRTRIRHPNHSIKGAKAAHAYLFKQGVDAATRERVFATVAWHQRIFRVMDREDPRAEAVRYSLMAPFLDLSVHGDADNEGRFAPDKDATRTSIELARMVADEEGCLDSPYPFENDEARVLFARSSERSYFHVPQPAKGSRVVVMSGLPGSGKSSYLKRRLAGVPRISLDALREELDVAPGKNQGAVVHAAFDRAKEMLRRREPFVWDAACLNRRIRDQVVDLCLIYDAHVSIHAMDTPWDVVLRQNRDRELCVPVGVLDDMVEAWEPPSPLEAHEVWRVSPKHELTRAFEYATVPVPAAAPAMS